MRQDSYNTKGSQNILAFLEQKKNSAVSAQDIADYLEANSEGANITTVYRRLEKLIAQKKVIRHTSEDGKKALFQYIAEDSECLNHLHIQCTKCSRIIHLDCSDSKSFLDHICNEHGITLDCKKTVLYGLCKECSK